MIPNNIKPEHILRAIEEADRSGIPVDRKSDRYDLVYNEKMYPPKYIISLANKYASNAELSHLVFGGGNEVNSFLQSRGFTTVKRDQYTKMILMRKSNKNFMTLLLD